MCKYWVIKIGSGLSAQEIEDTINRRASDGWRMVSTSVFDGSLYIFMEK